eukprot:355736-Chlamydomonas_euryale.AAC.2
MKAILLQRDRMGPCSPSVLLAHVCAAVYVQQCAVQWRAAQSYAVQRHTVQSHAVQQCAVQRRTVQSYAVQRHAMQSCTAQRHAMQQCSLAANKQAPQNILAPS